MYLKYDRDKIKQQIRNVDFEVPESKCLFNHIRLPRSELDLVAGSDVTWEMTAGIAMKVLTVIKRTPQRIWRCLTQRSQLECGCALKRPQEP